MTKYNILFLCTGNSCRSQMAEGWGRMLLPARFEVYSAGIEKHGINPLAVKVMAEVGVDISEQQSTLIEELPENNFDLVITLCEHAEANCPIYSGRSRKLHHGFGDPPKLAAHATAEEEKLPHYRRIRDDIKAFVEELPQLLMDS